MFNIHKYTDMLAVFGIATPVRRAAFWSQCDHESQHFTRLEENLNYSASGLAGTWPKRYAVDPGAKVKVPNALALSLHRDPIRIANNVYANRMGNGSEESGDGWLFRGSGLIQLTGRENHESFAKFKHITKLSLSANYIRTEAGAVESACWFWESHGCNELADTGSVEAVTKRVNGGLTGITERKALYAKYLRALA